MWRLKINDECVFYSRISWWNFNLSSRGGYRILSLKFKFFRNDLFNVFFLNFYWWITYKKNYIFSNCKFLFESLIYHPLNSKVREAIFHAWLEIFYESIKFRNFFCRWLIAHNLFNVFKYYFYSILIRPCSVILFIYRFWDFHWNSHFDLSSIQYNNKISLSLFSSLWPAIRT